MLIIGAPLMSTQGSRNFSSREMGMQWTSHHCSLSSSHAKCPQWGQCYPDKTGCPFLQKCKVNLACVDLASKLCLSSVVCSFTVISILKSFCLLQNDSNFHRVRKSTDSWAKLALYSNQRTLAFLLVFYASLYFSHAANVALCAWFIDF